VGLPVTELQVPEEGWYHRAVVPSAANTVPSDKVASVATAKPGDAIAAHVPVEGSKISALVRVAPG
jgi:hypothetical protein